MATYPNPERWAQPSPVHYNRRPSPTASASIRCAAAFDMGSSLPRASDSASSASELRTSTGSSVRSQRFDRSSAPSREGRLDKCSVTARKGPIRARNR